MADVKVRASTARSSSTSRARPARKAGRASRASYLVKIDDGKVDAAAGDVSIRAAGTETREAGAPAPAIPVRGQDGGSLAAAVSGN